MAAPRELGRHHALSFSPSPPQGRDGGRKRPGIMKGACPPRDRGRGSANRSSPNGKGLANERAARPRRGAEPPPGRAGGPANESRRLLPRGQWGGARGGPWSVCVVVFSGGREAEGKVCLFCFGVSGSPRFWGAAERAGTTLGDPHRESLRRKPGGNRAPPLSLSLSLSLASGSPQRGTRPPRAPAGR